VSAQTYALRAYNPGAPVDHAGFAWSPTNAAGLATADYTAQTNDLLTRLSAAIRDSAQPVDAANPGVGACGPAGQNLLCGGDLAGSAGNGAWKLLSTWRPEALAFTSAPQTLGQGVASAALSVALRKPNGVSYPVTSPLAVTLSSSSATGLFSTDAARPWTSTLTLSIPTGSSSVGFYYEDPTSGSPVVTAAAAGKVSATQTETISDTTAPDTTITAPPATTTASATLAFAASEAGTRFECSLDGAAFAACSSPVTLTGLADGQHVFQARAIDAPGNVDPTPAAVTWTVDTVAPDTTITAGPTAASTSFSFTSSEAAGRFECSLDGAPFAPCSSPVSYSSLAAGAHTFAVRAVDGAGNADASPATQTWTVASSI
jgi:hypothetical protein